MQCTNPPPAIGKTVNHDIAPRCDSALGRLSNVARICVGDVQSKMERALLLVSIDKISAFWSTVIALLLLRSNRRSA